MDSKAFEIKTYYVICESETAYGISVIHSSQNYRMFQERNLGKKLHRLYI